MTTEAPSAVSADEPSQSVMGAAPEPLARRLPAAAGSDGATAPYVADGGDADGSDGADGRPGAANGATSLHADGDATPAEVQDDADAELGPTAEVQDGMDAESDSAAEVQDSTDAESDSTAEVQNGTGPDPHPAAEVRDGTDPESDSAADVQDGTDPQSAPTVEVQDRVDPESDSPAEVQDGVDAEPDPAVEVQGGVDPELDSAAEVQGGVDPESDPAAEVQDGVDHEPDPAVAVQDVSAPDAATPDRDVDGVEVPGSAAGVPIDGAVHDVPEAAGEVDGTAAGADGPADAGWGWDGNGPAGAGWDGTSAAAAGWDGNGPADAGLDGNGPANAGLDGNGPADAGWDGNGATGGSLNGVAPTADDAAAAAVADRLGAVVGDGVDVDPAEFAAAAVLDVLRASGWADAAEAAELRAEADRLRELLNMVIRDHRAREASMVGVENQQLHWLVPLLRAAHGVAFGTLGAKVQLRSAVQDVPPEVLASAGLRIDYGIEPVYED